MNQQQTFCEQQASKTHQKENKSKTQPHVLLNSELVSSDIIDHAWRCCVMTGKFIDETFLLRHFVSLSS